MPQTNVISLCTDNNKLVFVISFPYHPSTVTAVKNIPSRKYDSKNKLWIVDANVITLKHIYVFAKKNNFDLDDEAKKYIDYMITSKYEDEVVKTDTVKRTLKDFQTYGVQYMLKHRRCFLADDMGLGKSLQSIVAIESANAYPCLIVCPASLKLNWKKEIEYAVDRTITVVDGFVKGDDVPVYNTDFVIINYDILDTKAFENMIGHKEFLKNTDFKSLIADESHYLSHSKSLRTKSVTELSNGIEYIYLLSGTPILNRPKELISQLQILKYLDTFGGLWGFAKKYCNLTETEYGYDYSGSSNLKELYDILGTLGFIRRLKTDVLDQLPPKQRTYIPIEITNESEYKKANTKFMQWMQDQYLGKDNEIYNDVMTDPTIPESSKKMVIFARVYSKMSGVQNAQTLVKMEKLKQIVAKGKLKKTFEFVDNILETGEKVVLFAHHKEIYNKIIDYYKDTCVFFISGMTSTQKDDAVTAFQNDATKKVFIGSIESANVGITLTASSTVVFVEFAYNFATHEQAEDRVYRIGQTNFVNCYYLYAENTIDKEMIEMIENKKDIMKQVVDGIEFDPDVTKRLLNSMFE